MTLDARPPIAALFAAFAIPGLVTPKGGLPVEATVLWDPAPDPLRVRSAFLAGAGELVDPRPTLNVRRSEVASLPLGSAVWVAPMGEGTPRTWFVDEVYETDPEVFRAVVH